MTEEQETPWQRYTRMKAAYDRRLLEWIDGGRKGSPPPRPILPHTPGPYFAEPHEIIDDD